MDKAHLNNYISKMRTSSKEAIRRTYQKLKKNETKLNGLMVKVKDEKKLNKIKNQIERSNKELRMIKSICPDEITKIACVILNFDGLFDCNELNLEEKLKIRIANSDVIQKLIKKFREDFPDSEQYIDVTIDLIDVKKIMKSQKNKELVKQIDKQLKQRRNILTQYRLRNKIEINQQETNELYNQNQEEIKKVMKRIKLSDMNNENTDDIDKLITEEKIINCTKEDKIESKVNLRNEKQADILDIIKSKFHNKKYESNSSCESDQEDQLNSSELNQKTDHQSDHNSNENHTENENSQSELEDECSNEEENCTDEEDKCSIDSYQFDNWVDESIQKENLQKTTSEDEDIVIEDYEEEESIENEENSNNDSTDLEQDNDLKTDKQTNSNKIEDIQKASEDYLKNQLVKAFGEEIANKTSKDDVSSDEEWNDDFFINKKVKKFKPTVVDLERYKDLEEKEQKCLEQKKEENDEKSDDDDQPKNKRFKKGKFSKRKKIKI